MLSYFGTDQSQVQRYLTAKSVDEGRESLLMSAYLKIPLQALMLLIGVLVFVFYLFTQPPMLFNPMHDARGGAGRAGGRVRRRSRASSPRRSRRAATRRWRWPQPSRAASATRVEPARQAFLAREAELERRARRAASALVTRGDRRRAVHDVNYVFPTFITTRMPIGLVGLMIAAIFAAAMSSIAAELNSLSTATVIDFYRRHVRTGRQRRPLPARVEARHRGLGPVRVRRGGLRRRPRVAHRGGQPLRVVLLRVDSRRVRARHRHQARHRDRRVLGPAARAWRRWRSSPRLTSISFLWHNVVGAAVVVVVGMAVSARQRRSRRGHVSPSAGLRAGERDER